MSEKFNLNYKFLQAGTLCEYDILFKMKTLFSVQILIHVGSKYNLKVREGEKITTFSTTFAEKKIFFNAFPNHD